MLAERRLGGDPRDAVLIGQIGLARLDAADGRAARRRDRLPVVRTVPLDLTRSLRGFSFRRGKELESDHLGAGERLDAGAMAVVLEDSPGDPDVRPLAAARGREEGKQEKECPESAPPDSRVSVAAGHRVRVRSDLRSLKGCSDSLLALLAGRWAPGSAVPRRLRAAARKRGALGRNGSFAFSPLLSS